jgi:hypothetical protein
MSKFGKILNNSGKTSTHRAENIFPKYLLYNFHEKHGNNFHEIARKYPREKKRYSSFSDSVSHKRLEEIACTQVHCSCTAQGGELTKL